MRRKAKLTIVITLFFLAWEIRLHRNLPCGTEFKKMSKAVVWSFRLSITLLYLYDDTIIVRKQPLPQLKKKKKDTNPAPVSTMGVLLFTYAECTAQRIPYSLSQVQYTQIWRSKRHSVSMYLKLIYRDFGRFYTRFFLSLYSLKI